MKRRYSVVLTPQPEGGYTVTGPDVPDLVTEGDTREEALAMARDGAEAGGRAEVATIEADLDAPRARLAAEQAATMEQGPFGGSPRERRPHRQYPPSGPRPLRDHR